MSYRIRLETLCGCTKEWEQTTAPSQVIKYTLANKIPAIGRPHDELPISMPFACRIFRFNRVADGVFLFIEWDPKLEPTFEVNWESLFQQALQTSVTE
jgi:hypothetical protein